MTERSQAEKKRITSDPARHDACLYLAVLAYPRDQEEQQRFLDAMDRMANKWERCSSKKRDDKRAIQRVRAIICNDRLPSAQVFGQLFPNAYRTAFGEGFQIRSSDAGPTKAVEHIEEHLTVNTETNNFLSRAWKPSRPVLHYAYGLWRQEPQSFFQLILAPSWVNSAIKIAVAVKCVLADYPLRDANGDILVAAGDLIDI